MHVVLCTDGIFPQALGGMQRHSRLLAEHLARAMADRTPGVPERFTVLHPHSTPVFDPSLGIHERSLVPIDPKRFYLRELYRYSGRVADTLDQLAPDVILSQGFCVWQGITRYTPKLIVHPHGLEMHQGLTMRDRLLSAPFRAVLRHVVRRSGTVISLGGKLTGILEGVASGSACRVVVLPNAAEVPPDPAPYPADDGPMRFLFVGRFAFNKGLDLLLQAAQRLHASRPGAAHFTLVGDGPLLAAMRSGGMPPNMELVGRVDDTGLDRLYRDHHALVLPTRFEGMPTVVLEAMARARPVVVSDVGASAELVDGSNGVLLPPGDVNALLGALQQLVDTPREQLARMGVAGHARALERFTWPAVTRAYIELFRQIHG